MQNYFGMNAGAITCHRSRKNKTCFIFKYILQGPSQFCPLFSTWPQVWCRSWLPGLQKTRLPLSLLPACRPWSCCVPAPWSQTKELAPVGLDCSRVLLPPFSAMVCQVGLIADFRIRYTIAILFQWRFSSSLHYKGNFKENKYYYLYLDNFTYPSFILHLFKNNRTPNSFEIFISVFNISYHAISVRIVT